MDSVRAALSQKAVHPCTPNPAWVLPAEDCQKRLSVTVSQGRYQRRDPLTRNVWSLPVVGRLKRQCCSCTCLGTGDNPFQGWRVPPPPIHPGGVRMLASTKREKPFSSDPGRTGERTKNVLICVQRSDLQPWAPSL